MFLQAQFQNKSRSINSLQIAKTEHWLSAGAEAKIISKLAGKKFALAGGLTANQIGILGSKVSDDTQFTSDKLSSNGYDNLGKQYGFFARYTN